MTLNYFSKYYEIQTAKSKKEIFTDIAKKIEHQERDKNIFSSKLVDYKTFKINGHNIEIERWMVNPLQGLGTINFKFSEKEVGTIIQCKTEPFILIGLLVVGFVLLLLIGMTTVIFWNSRDNYFELILFVLFAWIIGLGGPFLGYLYHRKALEVYSKYILNDLGINTTIENNK